MSTPETSTSQGKVILPCLIHLLNRKFLGNVSALFNYSLGKKQAKWGCCRTEFRLACISLQRALVLRLLPYCLLKTKGFPWWLRYLNLNTAGPGHSRSRAPCFCLAAGALTDTVLAQIMPGRGSSTDLTVHTLGMPKCEPGWATQPQHLRAIPGLGRFSMADLTSDGSGATYTHTNSA